MLDHHAAPGTTLGEYTLRPDARRFENWEFNYAAVLGLGAAVDYALDLGVDSIAARVVGLGAALRAQLAAMPKVTVTDLGRVENQCGIVTFLVDGMGAAEVQAQLLEVGGATVSVSGTASTLHDATERGLDDVLRASVHYYNTDAEIDAFVATLGKVIGV